MFTCRAFAARRLGDDQLTGVLHAFVRFFLCDARRSHMPAATPRTRARARLCFRALPCEPGGTRELFDKLAHRALQATAAIRWVGEERRYSVLVDDDVPDAKKIHRTRLACQSRPLRAERTPRSRAQAPERPRRIVASKPLEAGTSDGRRQKDRADRRRLLSTLLQPSCLAHRLDRLACLRLSVYARAGLLLSVRT